MTAEQKTTIIREDLTDFANEARANGIQLNSVRFKYNIQGNCTQVLLSYEETEEGEHDPMR